MDPQSPVRSCTGCRERRPWHELVRVTRSADGFVVGGASSGRGAWLCRADAGCLDSAITRKQFDRAWRTTLTDDELAALRAAATQDEQHTR